MNTAPVTPTKPPLHHAPPLQVQRNRTARVAMQTPPSPSPTLPLVVPQQTPYHSSQHTPVQASALAPSPGPQQAPGLIQSQPSQHPVPRPSAASNEEAQRAYAAPMPPPPPASNGPWPSLPYHLHNAQRVPRTPYDAIPPPALFVHALPTFMEPHTMGPIYTTPNGMLEYYAFADASGRTKITMTSWASSIQMLYRELGCTLPRYQEPEMPDPNRQS